MYEANPYYHPEYHSLKIIGDIDIGASYEFDMFVVWQHVDGTVYWAADSGCSCPSPFETFDSLEKLSTGSIKELQEAFHDFLDASYQRSDIKGPAKLAFISILDELVM